MTQFRSFPRLTTVFAAALLAAAPLGLDFSQGTLTLRDSTALASPGENERHDLDRSHNETRERAHREDRADRSNDDDHRAGTLDDDHGRGKARKERKERKERRHKESREHLEYAQPAGGPVVAVEIERSMRSIEVQYSDGTEEEIERGRYERKNAAGRTVEQRAATQADYDRLNAL